MGDGAGVEVGRGKAVTLARVPGRVGTGLPENSAGVAGPRRVDCVAHAQADMYAASMNRLSVALARMPFPLFVGCELNQGQCGVTL